jgi:phosphosulfolactate phosphohydrolase-like enzyme
LYLKQSGSGRELIQRGFPNDVALASMLDVSQTVPTLVNDAYIQLEK